MIGPWFSCFFHFSTIFPRFYRLEVGLKPQISNEAGWGSKSTAGWSTKVLLGNPAASDVPKTFLLCLEVASYLIPGPSNRTPSPSERAKLFPRKPHRNGAKRRASFNVKPPGLDRPASLERGRTTKSQKRPHFIENNSRKKPRKTLEFYRKLLGKKCFFPFFFLELFSLMGFSVAQFRC